MENTAQDSRFLVPCSAGMAIAWILATGIGFGVAGSAGLIWQGIVPCALLQALVICTWNRPLSWRWLLGTILLGMPVAFLAIIASFIMGAIGFIPNPVNAAIAGAMAGAAMGLGGWLALRSLGKNAWGWIIISAVAWALGAGLTKLCFSLIDPHGMSLFQTLTGAGLSDMTASRIVGRASGIPTGVIAGAVSAIGTVLVVRRSSGGQDRGSGEAS